MRNALRGGLIAITLGVGISALVAPLGGQQAPGYKAPRAADGHPDLNGIWQALNTANYDIEPHVARPAMALRPGPYGPLPAKEVLYLGAVGAVPAGMGIVDGGTIPYKPEALKIRNQNREKWAGARSGNQMLPAGCAAGELHALPVPDLPEPQRVLHRVRVRGRGAERLPEGSRRGAGRLPGWASRSDAGKARRSSSRPPASTARRGSIARAISRARS